MTLAPIVLFVYNRPWHTRQTVEALKKNELAEQSDLFIYSDGPKNDEDREKVEEVREYIKKITGFGDIIVVEREENMGLSKSIISGISEIIRRYGKVIVLEDDLVTSPYFLEYINRALDRYEQEEKVMHIAGYMLPVRDKLPETFFYRNTSCWGWATWKRAWDKFEPDAGKLSLKIKKRNLKFEFNMNGSANAYGMLLKQAQGRIDSWAIRWYATVFLDGGLCLHPGESLVNNIGHDLSGIHSASTDIFDSEVKGSKVSNFSMHIKEDEKVSAKIASFNRWARRAFIYRGLRGKIAYILFSSKTKLNAGG